GRPRDTPQRSFESAAADRQHLDELELVAAHGNDARLHAALRADENQPQIGREALQRIRDRDHRKHVTAGAATRQNQGVRAHAACPSSARSRVKLAAVTTTALASGAGPAATRTLLSSSREREIFKSSPIAAALTSSDDPP